MKTFVEPVKKLKHRDCYNDLAKFLEHDYSGKVLILYGLRRTGKTTLIRQAIASFPEKSVFMQIGYGMTLADVNIDDIEYLNVEDYLTSL